MGNVLEKRKETSNYYQESSRSNNEDSDEEFEEIFIEDISCYTKQCSPSQNESRKNTDTDNILVEHKPLNKESVAEKLSKADFKCRQTLTRWKNQQLFLKEQHILQEDECFLSNLTYIGGVDISFPPDKDDLVHACACLVVMTYPELKIVYKVCKTVHLTSVYIPEYLAFREVEPLKDLCEELKVENPSIYPQLILVDGNGVLHPRKFGLACQLGVVLDLPTIGVAKKLFHVDGLVKDKNFKLKMKTLESKGSSYELIGKSKYIYGKALRSTEKSYNPIFISIGHKICLDTAVDIVTKCCVMRIPEPVRWADILSREFIRDQYREHSDNCHTYNELNTYFLSLSKLM